MKRDRKRLSFNRESVRSLTTNELGKVAGGLIKTYVNDVCSYTNQQCATGGMSNSWCTSQLCPPDSAGCKDSWQCDLG